VGDSASTVNEEEKWTCELMKTNASFINMMIHFMQVVTLVTKRHVSHQQARDKSDTSLHAEHASTKVVHTVSHSIHSFGFLKSHKHMHIHDINIT
jgi:hypothetical protein